MEITFSDLEDSFDQYSPEEFSHQPWEKVGSAALGAMSSVAAIASLPACIRKRRSVTLGHPLQTPVATELTEPLPAVQFPLCNPTDRAKVKEIFNTIAEGGWTLVLKTTRLNKLGDEIDHLHPFSLLEAMPKKAIKTIFTTKLHYLAQYKTVAGIDKNMKRAKAGETEGYIPSFAAAMNKDEHRIRLFVRQCNWEGLVRYLYDAN